MTNGITFIDPKEVKGYIQESIDPESKKPKKVNRSKTKWIQS